MVCQRWCVTKCHAASPVPQVPRLPRKWKVNVTKCHACLAHGKSMSPSATPVMQMEGQSRQVPRLPLNGSMKVNVTKRHACHTNGKGQCHQGPRLPRKWKVNVTKCHAGYAKWRPGRPSALKRAQARHQSQPSTTTPRLPRKWKVNVTKDGV